MVMKENQIVTEEEIFKNKSVLAFIIDGEVVDTFVADERFAAILQSDPLIIELDAKGFTLNGPFRGWTYDGKDFYPPNLNFQN
jgi:hypothetical protein